MRLVTAALLGALAVALVACARPASETSEPATGGPHATSPGGETRGATATPSPRGGARSSPSPTPREGAFPRPASCQPATLIRVIDGDTIAVEVGGGRDTVRLIGVDAPELHHATRGAEPYGAEAAAYLARLLEGRRLCLERDVSDRDRYGRLLRYVWLEDGTLVNEALVAAGMATVATFPPDVKYTDSRLLPAQRAARAAGVGLWGTASPVPSPPPGGAPTSSGGSFAPPSCYVPGRNSCNCSDFSSRAHAQWFHETLDPQDVNRLDGDGDGLACESLP